MDEVLARRVVAMLDSGVDIQTVAHAHGVMEDGVWEAMAVVAGIDYPPGTRVRLRGTPIPLTLRSSVGTVVGPAEGAGGYLLVRLDEPAIYHQADGTEYDLDVICEMADNLERE